MEKQGYGDAKTSVRHVVCQVVAEAYCSGGLEKHFIELCNALSKQCEVHAIAHESYRQYLHSRVTFHPLDLSRSRRSPLLLWQLLWLIRSVGPDVVHSHAKKAGLIVSQIARFIQPVTVVTIHNLTASKRWMRRYNGIVCVSKTITDSLPGLPVHVVYNGIENLAVEERFEFPTDGLNVLAAGRLAHAKGFDTLIEAFKRVDATLYIAGEGDKREYLENLACKLDLQDKVKFLGYRKDLPCLISASDLVVISSNREGFSYVFAEAMFANVPVISTDVPVPCEILSSEFLVPIGDAALLGDKVQKTLDQLDDVTNTFDEWFRFGRATFTIQAMVENTCAVYSRTRNIQN